MDISSMRPRSVELKGEHLFYNALTYMQDDKRAMNLQAIQDNILGKEEFMPQAVLNGFLKKLNEYVELELIDLLTINEADYIFWSQDKNFVIKEQFGIVQKVHGNELT
ncbi:hypothetical protein [Salinicola rhizosphaerae]|uniref:hypothetical protein n=1 Tax=Salinicola rhizosphaerae TaxID=1443141 RepID=UPI001677A929|nr:hypothetical protein [Salinicola rhizosphaerae]